MREERDVTEESNSKPEEEEPAVCFMAFSEKEEQLQWTDSKPPLWNGGEESYEGYVRAVNLWKVATEKKKRKRAKAVASHASSPP